MKNYFQSFKSFLQNYFYKNNTQIDQKNEKLLSKDNTTIAKHFFSTETPKKGANVG